MDNNSSKPSKGFSGSLVARSDGFSLIEMLLAAGVVSILSLAFGTVILQMSKEMKWSNQKADATDFRTNFAVTLANLPICSCQIDLNTGTFDSTSPSSVLDINDVKSSCDPAVAAEVASPNIVVPGSYNQLTIEKMSIINIQSLGPADQYRGKLSVTYKANNLIRPLQGFTSEIQFQTDPATPATAKHIKACTFFGGTSSNGSSGAAADGLCDPGKFVIGIKNGVILCSGASIAGKCTNDGGTGTGVCPGGASENGSGGTFHGGDYAH